MEVIRGGEMGAVRAVLGAIVGVLAGGWADLEERGLGWYVTVRIKITEI